MAILRKYQTGGAIYLYDKRPGVTYKKVGGQWHISTDETGNYKPIVDKDGARTKELNKNARLDPNLNSQDVLDKAKYGTVKLIDNRSIVAATGNPMRDSDRKTDEYSAKAIIDITKAAKKYGITPSLAIATAIQESKLGSTDSNYGHTKMAKAEGITEAEHFVKTLHEHLQTANRKGLKDPYLRMQVYNGWKTFTTKDFGSDMAYGMKIPAEGIDMRTNPLYGKQVYDLQKKLIKNNPQVMGLIYKTMK